VSVCVTTNTLDFRSIYPVIDPRRTAGPGPYNYGYVLAWDALLVTVERPGGLSSCEMIVNLTSTLSEAKEIQAWNLFGNNFVDRIGSFSLGLQSSMNIQKAGASGLSCGSGADTVILCRYFAWPRGRTALYTFTPQDFWDFWGGCIVTFDWVSDTQGSNLWGNQTLAPVYPDPQVPDRTLMNDGVGGLLVAFGGASFKADSTFLSEMGLNPSDAIGIIGLPSTPADGTLVREFSKNDIFVVYGGAKFQITNQPEQFINFWFVKFPVPNPELLALGFDWSQVKIIPDGGTAQLLKMPIDGTLLREQNGAKVFLVDKGQLRWVTSPAAMDSNCLPWRHIRIVPDNTLTGLTLGPVLNP
jgi:hypothetical protein